MSAEGRTLQVGDYAFTDFDGRMKMVLITARIEGKYHSQSGIQFGVSPPMRNGAEGKLYDADWFEPVPNKGNP